MAEKNKSIIESALLDAKRIQEALNANTKEILRTVAIEEIDGLVKESLEEGYVEEDADETDDVEVTATDVDSDETDDVDSDEIEVDDTDELGGDAEEDSTEDDLMGSDSSMGADALGGDSEVSDMTTAPMDDVISVYKKLTGDDEIEVVVDDESGDIKLSVNEPGEFVIKTGAGEAEELDEYSEMQPSDLPKGMSGIEAKDGTEEVDEVMYEIALDEMENIDGIKAPLGNENDDNWAGDNLEGGFDEKKAHAKAEGDMVMSESEEIEEVESKMEENKDSMEEVEDKMEEGDEHIDEYIRKTKPQGMRAGAEHQPKTGGALEESVNKYNTLLTEAKELRGKNEEYKQALKQFRTMLAETVVFNSNLTYVTKLFMEHSTTKEEKQAILKRFDNEVSTLKESKRLYKTIASELTSRKPMNESIERKLNNEVSSSVSKQLNESTAYIDKETQRIKDLMSRVEKR